MFAEIAAALHAGDVSERIGGRVAQTGFARLTDPVAAGARSSAAPMPERP